jgi:flagellar hook-associated protein 3 FlgL
MDLRVNPDVFTGLLNAIEADQQQLDIALRESATGKRVHAPADDPGAVAGLIQNLTQSSAIDQFTHSIATLQGQLQAGDGALNAAVQLLTQAISLGVEGANGTLTQADRQGIANQVIGIQQDLLEQANSTYQDNYIFAGTAVKTAPFVADSTSPSGVRYVGNEDVNSVEIAPGQLISVNLPGDQIFDASNGDAFQALHDLINALETNGDIAGATAEVNRALSAVSLQRTFYGSTLNNLTATGLGLSQQRISLAQQQNDLIGIDPAKAITDLVQADTTLQAALESFAKIPQNTLFDYLR